MRRKVATKVQSKREKRVRKWKTRPIRVTPNWPGDEPRMRGQTKVLGASKQGNKGLKGWGERGEEKTVDSRGRKCGGMLFLMKVIGRRRK